jgi:prevent-host-death family protein
MIRLSATKAREVFSDVINRVSYRGERILLERHGKDVVALVPVDDLELLEALEDRLDLEEAKGRLKEPGRISWNELKERLGLDRSVQDRVPADRRTRARKASRR